MSITTTSVDKATVILVHGAFAESSSWNGVIAPLLDDGYPVLAVANPCAASRATPTTCTASFWFLFGTEDKNCPTAAHRFMGRRAGSRRTVELQGGSHAVAIPEAAAVVDLIREAATGGAVR